MLAVAPAADAASPLRPAGPVGQQQIDLVIMAAAIMALVVVPVFVMTAWFVWRYRAANRDAMRCPRWTYNGWLDAVIWLLPAVLVAAMAVLAWRSAHRLDPYRPLAAAAPGPDFSGPNLSGPDVSGLDVEVVALDWKWLFIYPAAGIASVNRLVIPAGLPVSFRITSDSVMNSFFIPALGSQVYAMAGMATRLHLQADRPGRLGGISANFSGRGFAGMDFPVIVLSAGDYAAWQRQGQAGASRLDATAWRRLRQPSRGAAAQVFARVEPGLFEAILDEYRGGH